MKNPFEEKRKNDRINRLVKENTDLKEKLADVTKALDGFEMQKRIWDDIAKVNQKLRKDIVQSKKLYNDGYNQAVWDITHFLTDKQKEVNND